MIDCMNYHQRWKPPKKNSQKLKKRKLKSKQSELQNHSKNHFTLRNQKNQRSEPINSLNKSRQSFELTTLTNISKKESKFPLFEKEEQKSRTIPEPKIIQPEIIKPKEEVLREIIQPKPKS